MLFRDKNGKLIKINRTDFINDKEYYTKIALINGIHFYENNKNTNNTIQYILNIIKK